MNATLNNMEYLHVDLSNSFGIQTTVGQCLDCHSYSPGYVTEAYGFGTLIHGLHDKTNQAFKNMNGDCWSCHSATGNGEEMQLWDLTKHDLLRGIVDVENVAGEFSADQNKVTKAEDLFFFNWMYYENDYPRYAAEYADAPSIPKFLTIGAHGAGSCGKSLHGQADRPDRRGPFRHHHPDHALHDQPLRRPADRQLRNQGHSAEDAAGARGREAGGHGIAAGRDGRLRHPDHDGPLDEHEAYVVYEIDGQRLSHAHGYPAQLWVGSGSAAEFVKQISVFEVLNEPQENYYMYLGWESEGGYTNKPNVGIFDVQEGQIIPAGQPFTFSGYADAFDQRWQDRILHGRGATWTSYDISGLNPDIWVNWHFTFTPEEPGAYVLKVRAVTDAGLVSNTPGEIMVNAK